MEIFQKYMMNNFSGFENAFSKLKNNIDIFFIITSNLLLSKINSIDVIEKNKNYIGFSEKSGKLLENVENKDKELLNIFCQKNNFKKFIEKNNVSLDEDLIILLYSMRFCLEIIKMTIFIKIYLNKIQII